VKHDQALGDHYDPTHKRLARSRETFHGTSVAAQGVAAHECGQLCNTWMLMRHYNGGWPQWV
jgi:Zn-dependent membrane protease YugP